MLTMEDTLISHDQLLELLESVWSSMLYVPVEAVSPQGEFPEQSRLTVSVQIAGEWNGTVLLYLTQPFAELAAATMLAIGKESLTEADLHDAAAELCNILGGSIKSLLPGRNTLSLPMVVKGEDFRLRVPNTRLVAAMDARSAGEPLRIKILARADRKSSEASSSHLESISHSLAGDFRGQ
jgi:hypothetical protein